MLQQGHLDLNKFSVNKLRTELWTCHLLSERRCLRKACEWAEDLLFALPEEGEEKLLTKLEKDLFDCTSNYNPKYEHAKMCFELQEYDRAAHVLRDQLHEDESRFLHYFSRYKGAEKKRIDLMNEVTTNISKKAMLKFSELRDSLERSMETSPPDGWLLYVYGLVLHKFKLQKMAVDVLVRSINQQPNNWSAWFMLTILIDSKNQLHSLPLPNHLFRIFFYCMIRLELDMTLEDTWKYNSSKEIKNFTDKYFRDSLFVQTLESKSIGYQNSGYNFAIQSFAHIRQKDPYRIEATEIYSNLLYVKKFRKELSKLAYEIEKVDPFTSESNSCIANSYSARDQHAKAIVYFTRALRINPDSSNSWTLIGHEYLEMKNTDKAIQAYRHAISTNKRDCRAWLGLGNTFETTNSSPTAASPNFSPCLYYYSQVARYRPKDHIMYMAMGCVYNRLDDFDLTVICLKRAGPEGMQKLVKICEENDITLESTEESYREH